MEKYAQLVKELYTEPKNEEILGSFLQAETTEDASINVAPRNVRAPKKKKRSKSKQRIFDSFLIKVKQVVPNLNQHHTKRNRQTRHSLWINYSYVILTKHKRKNNDSITLYFIIFLLSLYPYILRVTNILILLYLFYFESLANFHIFGCV